MYIIGRVKRDSASPLRPNNNFSSKGSVVIWQLVLVVLVLVLVLGSVVLGAVALELSLSLSVAGLDGCGNSAAGSAKCCGTRIVSLSIYLLIVGCAWDVDVDVDCECGSSCQ